MDSIKTNIKTNNIDHYLGPAGNNIDMMSLHKQNQQLRGIIMLHLDLIQEHTEASMAKDKILNALREENERLKQKIEKLEKKISQDQKKKTPNKQQHTGNHEDKKENLLDISNKGSSNFVTSVSRFTSAPENCYKVEDSSGLTDDSIIGEQNGKIISKIVLHRVPDKDGNEVIVKESDESMSCDSNLVVEKVSCLTSCSNRKYRFLTFHP